MTRLLAVVAAIVAIVVVPMPQALADQCPDPNNPACEQHQVTADQQAGDFHGLIMVAGRPAVLDRAAHAGTKPGCGDCTWTLILACLYNNPNAPQDQNPCATSSDSPGCQAGEMLWRIYLSTDAVRNELVDVVCLGGTNRVVPIGDRAADDVQRYLRDVTPPNLDLHIAPPKGIPAGMPAYFWVRPPADLTPVPFGNGQITETITITPVRYDWTWGDGATSGWTTDAGAPYPNGTLTHTYVKADHYAGQLVTEWGGTYTITVAGQTFGPYTAIGTVTKRQTFTTTVLRARSTLVSH